MRLNMDQKKVEQEKKYHILKNPAGHLMILIRARLENAESPTIIYDGGEHALLYRNQNNTIVLDYIHPAVRSDLMSVKDILIVEVQGESIIREYNSQVKQMKHIPIPSLIN